MLTANQNGSLSSWIERQLSLIADVQIGGKYSRFKVANGQKRTLIKQKLRQPQDNRLRIALTW